MDSAPSPTPETGFNDWRLCPPPKTLMPPLTHHLTHHRCRAADVWDLRVDHTTGTPSNMLCISVARHNFCGAWGGRGGANKNWNWFDFKRGRIRPDRSSTTAAEALGQDRSPRGASRPRTPRTHAPNHALKTDGMETRSPPPACSRTGVPSIGSQTHDTAPPPSLTRRLPRHRLTVWGVSQSPAGATWLFPRPSWRDGTMPNGGTTTEGGGVRHRGRGMHKMLHPPLVRALLCGKGQGLGTAPRPASEGTRTSIRGRGGPSALLPPTGPSVALYAMSLCVAVRGDDRTATTLQDPRADLEQRGGGGEQPCQPVLCCTGPCSGRPMGPGNATRRAPTRVLLVASGGAGRATLLPPAATSAGHPGIALTKCGERGARCAANQMCVSGGGGGLRCFRYFEIWVRGMLRRKLHMENATWTCSSNHETGTPPHSHPRSATLTGPFTNTALQTQTRERAGHTDARAQTRQKGNTMHDSNARNTPTQTYARTSGNEAPRPRSDRQDGDAAAQQGGHNQRGHKPPAPGPPVAAPSSTRRCPGTGDVSDYNYNCSPSRPPDLWLHNSGKGTEFVPAPCPKQRADGPTILGTGVPGPPSQF